MLTICAFRPCFNRLALIAMLLSTATVAAQAQSSWVFEDFYGNRGVSDFGMCVKTTEDGGAITIGASESFGAANPLIHIIRVDPLGNPVWESTYDQHAITQDMSIAVCDNGDFVWTAGVILPGQTTSDILVVRTGPDGSPLWARLVGRNNNRNERAHAILEAQNGDIAVSGVTDNVTSNGMDLLVSRFEQDGTWLWSFHYGSAEDDKNHGLVERGNGNLIAAGAISAEAGGYDAWLLEIDPAGNPGWSHSYGPNDGFNDWFLNVIEHPATGELYAVGHYQRLSGFGSSLIVAVDPNSGTFVHTIHYRHNLAAANFEAARSIAYAPADDEFVVCGRYRTAAGVVQPYTAAFPADLSTPLWMLRRQQPEAGTYRSIDITDGNQEYDQGGGFWIAGSVSEDMSWPSTRRYHSLTRSNWKGKTDCVEDLDWDFDPSMVDRAVDIEFDEADEAVEFSIKKRNVKSGNEVCPAVWLNSHAKSIAAPKAETKGLQARLHQSVLRRGDDLTLKFGASGMKVARIVITDVRGRVYHDAASSIRGDQEVIAVKTNGWVSGTYYLQISLRDDVQAMRFVIRN